MGRMRVSRQAPGFEFRVYRSCARAGSAFPCAALPGAGSLLICLPDNRGVSFGLLSARTCFGADPDLGRPERPRLPVTISICYTKNRLLLSSLSFRRRNDNVFGFRQVTKCKRIRRTEL